MADLPIPTETAECDLRKWRYVALKRLLWCGVAAFVPSSRIPAAAVCFAIVIEIALLLSHYDVGVRYNPSCMLSAVYRLVTDIEWAIESEIGLTF